MKPYIHAQSSVKTFGGKVEDYLPIHDFMDSSKQVLADVRHRAIFHSAFGIFIVEKVFGVVITNGDGKEISVRDIAEQHIIEDLGRIPTVQDWLLNLPIEDWMISKSVEKEQKQETDWIPLDKTNMPHVPYPYLEKPEKPYHPVWNPESPHKRPYWDQIIVKD